MTMLDFDLDGDLDIATSDWKGFERVNGPNGTVSVLENLRDGIFGTTGCSDGDVPSGRLHIRHRPGR